MEQIEVFTIKILIRLLLESFSEIIIHSIIISEFPKNFGRTFSEKIPFNIFSEYRFRKKIIQFRNSEFFQKNFTFKTGRLK